MSTPSFLLCYHFILYLLCFPPSSLPLHSLFSIFLLPSYSLLSSHYLLPSYFPLILLHHTPLCVLSQVRQAELEQNNMELSIGITERQREITRLKILQEQVATLLHNTHTPHTHTTHTHHTQPLSYCIASESWNLYLPLNKSSLSLSLSFLSLSPFSPSLSLFSCPFVSLPHFLLSFLCVTFFFPFFISSLHSRRGERTCTPALERWARPILFLCVLQCHRVLLRVLSAYYRSIEHSKSRIWTAIEGVQCCTWLEWSCVILSYLILFYLTVL